MAHTTERINKMAEGQVRFSEDVWGREGTGGRISPIYNIGDSVGYKKMSEESTGT